MSDTPETDSARMEGYVEFSGDLFPLYRHHYEKHPEGDVVFAEVAGHLELERDEARREVTEILSCINQAIDFHKIHDRMSSVWLLRDLLANINKRRKRNE